MTTMKRYVYLGWLALGGASLFAGTITPSDVGAVCGVAPFAGGAVASGMTTPAFFSDLSGSSCSGPIVTILADVTLYDDNLDPIAGNVTGVSVTQGGVTSILPLDAFVTPTAVTYGPTLNTPNSVTVNPGDVNLAFTISIPPSQYSYSLITDGNPSIAFATWNDVEAAKAPELSCLFLAGSGLCAFGMLLKRRGLPDAAPPQVVRPIPTVV
jgi:hypothetical protein